MIFFKTTKSGCKGCEEAIFNLFYCVFRFGDIWNYHGNSRFFLIPWKNHWNFSRPICGNPGFVVTWLCQRLKPEQNGWLFADVIFKLIFLKENPCIFILISTKFFPKDSNDNKSALVQATGYYLKQRWPKSLTHWGWDKMDDIFQTTFSNAFSWMKICEFWLRFHWSVFLRVQLTIFQHWFR